MLTIAEKPEFMKARTVKVCTKTVILSSKKAASEKRNLDSSS